MPTGPAPNDHLRPVDADRPAGVYRVVGTGDPVVLLRVTDGDGRRVHTGEIVAVDRAELAGFESAADPGDRTAGVGAAAGVAYWTAKVFVGRLAARPLATAAGLGLVAVGAGGDAVGLPATVAAALVVSGSLGLAYVASGRPS